MADETNTIEQNLGRAQNQATEETRKQTKNIATEVVTDSINSNEGDKAAAEIRRQELTDQLLRQVTIESGRARFRDNPTEIAFKDLDGKLSTNINDPKAVQAMLIAAELKDWKSIKVSGHQDFRRQVWEEATKRGVKVQGYEPTRQEKEVIDRLLERRERSNQVPIKNKGATRGGDVEPVVSGASGVLENHGKAPYNNDPKNNASYFAKLKTPKGTTTLWGVGLEKAIADGEFKKGDSVKIERHGREPVSVETVNAKGERETVTANRTSFSVSAVAKAESRAKTVERVAVAMVEKTVQNPNDQKSILTKVREKLQEKLAIGQSIPAVQRYDPKAPSQQKLPDRDAPVVQNVRERSR